MGFRSNNKILIDLNPRYSPLFWVTSIFENLDIRSVSLVATYLVAAVLRKSHPKHPIDIRSTKGGYVKSRHSKIVTIGPLIYHIATKPDATVVSAHTHGHTSQHKMILLVPKTKIKKVFTLAKERKLKNRINIFSIEEYIATKIILMSSEKRLDPCEIFKETLHEYEQLIKTTKTGPRLDAAKI